MGQKAFIIIDMLNDFVQPGAPLEVPKARDIIPHIKKRVEEARNKGIPIIYLCDHHQPDDKEFNVWLAHAVKGTEGAEIVDELKPHEEDYAVPKISYSAFYNTALEERLKFLDHSIYSNQKTLRYEYNIKNCINQEELRIALQNNGISLEQ